MRYYRLAILSAILILAFTVAASAQPKTLAIIAADNSEQTKTLANSLGSLSETFRLADPDLVANAVSASPEKNILNLSRETARNIGTGIGCDYLLILKSENLRRSSSQRNVYFESYLVVFFVDARTGKLLVWKYVNRDADDAPAADRSLHTAFKELPPMIPVLFASAMAEEKNYNFDTSLYEIKDSTENLLRTPLPFRRYSPVSTQLAQHLRIEATVDIEVAIDAKGYIIQTRIVRWAGFGLDDAVTDNVRKMNFRPAILDGKAIPARFLLRYNFRIPTEDKRP